MADYHLVYDYASLEFENEGGVIKLLGNKRNADGTLRPCSDPRFLEAKLRKDIGRFPSVESGSEGKPHFLVACSRRCTSQIQSNPSTFYSL
jgi:hypothetical protein